MKVSLHSTEEPHELVFCRGWSHTTANIRGISLIESVELSHKASPPRHPKITNQEQQLKQQLRLAVELFKQRKAEEVAKLSKVMSEDVSIVTHLLKDDIEKELKLIFNQMVQKFKSSHKYHSPKEAFTTACASKDSQPQSFSTPSFDEVKVATTQFSIDTKQFTLGTHKQKIQFQALGRTSLQGKQLNRENAGKKRESVRRGSTKELKQKIMKGIKPCRNNSLKQSRSLNL